CSGLVRQFNIGTVVVGELDDGRIRYRAVSACSLLLGQLDGKLLLTVEDLAEDDGGPHPAQRAAAVAGASPCGFCAPGVAMTLFALWRADPTADDERVRAALAGNVCRCADDRPVIDAVRR
ncbi:xanthine dehydrogenase small subunit, partial [bacterium]|nr:xanthine dehydrogenase small subunit [bacterium]